MEEQLTFEEAFQQLEETVQRLEAGGLSLAEALELFEKGTRLATLCERQLGEAELRVRQIVPDATGGFEAVPFEEWQKDG